MRSDALLALVPIGAPLSLVGAAGVSIPSPNVIDLLGQGVGQAPANIIGNAALFGEDAGIGGIRPQLNVTVGTSLVTATAATLNAAIQGAADTGAGGNYQPGTWQTLEETGPLTAAQLVSGVLLARFDFPPAFPSNLRPRFIRLLFQIPTGTSFTAGTVASAIVTLVRDDQANKYQPNNYTVR
jgi:hypothetical protein